MKSPDSLEARLRDFFARNPGEMLSFADIETKFDAREANIRRAVTNARKQGKVRVEYVVMAGAE